MFKTQPHDLLKPRLQLKTNPSSKNNQWFSLLRDVLTIYAHVSILLWQYDCKKGHW